MEHRIDYRLTNRLIWSTGDISRFIMIAAVALITKCFILHHQIFNRNVIDLQTLYISCTVYFMTLSNTHYENLPMRYIDFFLFENLKSKN